MVSLNPLLNDQDTSDTLILITLPLPDLKVSTSCFISCLMWLCSTGSLPGQQAWLRSFASFNPAPAAFDAILNAIAHANQGQGRLSPSN